MRNKEIKKEIVAGFELTIMFVSMFAFSYGISLSNNVFSEITVADNLRDGFLKELLKY